jgi:aspartyl protease family protein
VGTFRVALEIGDPEGSRWETVEALVDTGASYTLVPRHLLLSLGVRTTFRRPFTLADGRQVDCEMAETRVRLDGQTRTTLVIFGEEGAVPLLGAYTLEGFGLAPDPVNRRLISVPGLLMDIRRFDT